MVGYVTGCEEYIVNEQNGLIVDAGDVPAAATAVSRLIGDPVLRGKLVEAGHATARAWSWERSFAAMRDLIDAR